MPSDPRVLRALVLQGGGALGAFELGVARVLYGERAWRPDLIAGVSIGAITAALLARPKGGDGIAALEAFWKEVAVAGSWLFEPLRPYAASFGNPRFFMPRTDVWNASHWTSLYDTAPLKATLAGLIDEDALADPDAFPRLLFTATDVEAGEIKPFYSGGGGLKLDHILASGALPPGFPMIRLGEAFYWDGGLFDNTPLGEIVGYMNRAPERAHERQIVVVNLFPNKGPIPKNLAQVAQRGLNLTFANKTRSDLGLMQRFNAIARLMDMVRADPRWADLVATDEFQAADRDYIEIPDPVQITRDTPADGDDGIDFLPATIEARIDEGERATRAAFAERPQNGGAAAGAAATVLAGAG